MCLCGCMAKSEVFVDSKRDGSLFLVFSSQCNRDQVVFQELCG